VPATTELLDAARRALLDDRRQLTLDELSDLAGVPDADDAPLAALAHEVRLAWCGDVVEVEGILSAKTGGCPEDCQFCSQSARYGSPVKAIPLLGHDEVVAAARETAALGASEFCLVYAVRGPDERLMAHLEEVEGDLSGRARKGRRASAAFPALGASGAGPLGLRRATPAPTAARAGPRLRSASGVI
jgi:2-iminoacetate synthase ThiH